MCGQNRGEDGQSEPKQRKEGRRGVNEQWNFPARPLWASLRGDPEFPVLLWSLKPSPSSLAWGGPGVVGTCRQLYGAVIWGGLCQRIASRREVREGSMQKTHLIHFNAICSKLVAKNGASGCFPQCNNNRHSCSSNIYLCVSDAILGVCSVFSWFNNSGQCKLIQ